MSQTVHADVAVKVLERAARGQSWLRIGRELALPAAEAEAIGVTFGYPSASHMKAAVNNLAGLGRELVTYGADVDPRRSLVPPVERAGFEFTRPASVEQRLREDAPELSPAELIEQTVRALSVDQLLERAAASSRGSVRADGARVGPLLERIRVAIIRDEREAATRARVAELRQELARLEGTASPRARHTCPRPGCGYSTVQLARFTAHTAAHEESTDA